MCHLGVNQLITVYHFSLLCEMDESSSRFRIPKSSNEEKASIINSVPKSTVYKNKWAIQIFREWQGQRANKICTIEPGGVFKGEDIGLDVQESRVIVQTLFFSMRKLTENKWSRFPQF